MWHILEHIVLVLSLGLNVFFLVYLAILFRLPQAVEEMRKPAFPNLHSGGKMTMAEAWTEGQKDPWTASIRQLNSTVSLPKEHSHNVPMPNVRQVPD